MNYTVSGGNYLGKPDGKPGDDVGPFTVIRVQSTPSRRGRNDDRDPM